jgi:rare lipoprotein A
MHLAAVFTMSVCAMLLMSACGKPAPVVAPLEVPQGTSQISGSGGVYKVGAPYTVAGRRYTPRVQPNYRAEGLASWYGPKFHGKRTANGEIFDQYAVTAAHQTLPLPSKVRVTNLDNGRQLVVRVNDRGPFIGDRIIDLSRRSAQLLGVEKVGVAPVRLELLDSGPHLLTEPQQQEQVAHEAVTPVGVGRVYVQVGAFQLPDNAQRLAWRLSRFGDPSIHVSENHRWHRVRFGPFASAREADTFVQSLERAGYLPNVVVQIR